MSIEATGLNGIQNYAIYETFSQEAFSEQEKDNIQAEVPIDVSMDSTASSCYDKSLFLQGNHENLLAKMLSSMGRVEKIENIYELKDMAYCGELYSFTIRDGIVHISGGEGYEHKARAYEKLVNASLNHSWSCLFRNGIVSEQKLIKTVDDLLKYYTGIDHEIIKNNKYDSIANHVEEAFQRWCDEHPMKQIHFEGRI